MLLTYVCIYFLDYDSTALVARKHGAVVCPRLIDLAGESVPAAWALKENQLVEKCAVIDPTSSGTVRGKPSLSKGRERERGRRKPSRDT